MRKNYFTLPNGLTVVYNKDARMHTFTANLIVKYGYTNNQIIKDGKLITTHSGITHLLEHLLIEHSFSGCYFKQLEKENVSCNGYTTAEETIYYIKTVHDFETYLFNLIKMVNLPCFNENDTQEVKYSIINELNMTRDNKFRHLLEITNNCLFQKINVAEAIRTKQYIEAISYEEVKLCYDTFYNPANQILTLCGNLNIKQIKELINDCFKKINRETNNYVIPKIIEPLEVNHKEDYYECLTDNYTQVTFKIKFSDYSSVSKHLLSYYLDFFLSDCFGYSSLAYQNVIKNKISNFDIDYRTRYLNEYLIISIGTYTDKSSEFINIVLDTFKNKPFSAKIFALHRKQLIMSFLIGQESAGAVLDHLIDNILTYDYYEKDKLEDFTSMNFKDYQRMIKEVDFSHYVITYLKSSKTN